ncbi:MAG TPA: hypothetical protein VL651_16790, partial [Bacteroidia bacterium]|nr:hypothetical protein [Bacteroidia bacterium]
KCQLKKRLQKEEENQGAKFPGSLKDKSEQVVYCETEFSGFTGILSSAHIFSPILMIIPSAPTASSFRPPGNCA